MTKEIVSHDFEQAKKEIQQFSEKSPVNVHIERVNESHFWGLWEDNVKGRELNEVTEKIQRCFTGVNKNVLDIYRELGKIYNAFEALDKDYIAGILSAIKSAEAASEQAMNASEQAMRANLANKKNIDRIQNIVKILKEHHEKLQSYNHIADIDAMWAAVDMMTKNIQECKGQFDIIQNKLQGLENGTVMNKWVKFSVCMNVILFGMIVYILLR